MATGEEKMPLPPDIRATASEAAIEWDNVGKEIGLTDIASAKVTDIPGWEGEAQAAYRDSAEKLKAHTQTLMGIFPEIKKALDTWSEAVGTAISTTVPGFWVEYDAATTTYNSGIDAINDDIQQANNAGSPIPDSEVSRREVALRNTREDEYNRVLGEYKKAMEALDQVAQDSAGIIDGKVASLVNPDVANKGRDAIGADLFNDIPLIDGQAEWEYAQHVAPDIAAAMKDPNLTDEELKQFHDKYGKLLDDPFYANALAELVSPDDMTQFALRVSCLPSADPAVAQDVLRSVGTALVLSSGGMNVEGDMADKQYSFDLVRNGLLTDDGKSIEDLTQRRLQDFQTAGRTTYHLNDFSSSSSWAEIPGYDILSQLMGAAAKDNTELSLGQDFFEMPDGGRSVAQDIVAWDNETKEWAIHPAERWKYTMFPGTEYGGDQSICDPLHSMYLLMDQPDSLDSLMDKDPSLLTDKEKVLVHANNLRMDGIRGFLTSDTPFQMDVEEYKDTDGDGIPDKTETTHRALNMTQYLTGWRQGSMAWDYFGFQDGGEAFGEAIRQVSEPVDCGREPDISDSAAHELWEKMSKRDHDATDIAMNFMRGYQDGLDYDYGQFLWSNNDQHDGQDVFGYNNQQLRSWAGVILAPHMSDVALSMNIEKNDFGVMNDPLTGDHYFTLPKDFVDSIKGTNGFFVDLGFDEPEVDNRGTDDTSDDVYVKGRRPAFDNLLLGAQAGYEEDIVQAHLTGTQLNGVTSDWSALMRALFSAPAEASGEALQALDDRNARWQGLITAGIGAVPFGDIIDDKAVNWLIDQGKANGMAPVLDTFLSTDNAAGNQGNIVSREEMAEQYMKDSLITSLAGAVGPDGQPVINMEAAETFSKGQDSNYQFCENGAIIPPAQMTVAQRNAFETFLVDAHEDYRHNGVMGHDYGEELDHIKVMLNMADIETEESRVLKN